jgi:hypothetical protein
MSKKLYTAFSFFDFIWFLVLRLVCVIGVVYFTTIYNENPPVILFILIICCILIFILGDDKITIYEDRIEQSDNSFSSLFFKSKVQTYLIEDIKFAYTPQKPTSSKTEIGVAMLIKTLLPKQRSQLNNSSSFYLDLINGGTKEIETSLGESEIKNLVKDINSLVKRNGIL